MRGVVASANATASQRATCVAGGSAAGAGHIAGAVHALPVAEGYQLAAARKCLAASRDFEFADLHSELRSGALRAVCSSSGIAKWGQEHGQGQAFVFSRGTLVAWNMTEETLQQLRRELRAAEVNAYTEQLVDAERESLMCLSGSVAATTVDDDGVWLPDTQAGKPQMLDAFAISHGLAISVQLGVFECELQEYAAAFTWVLQDVREGRAIRIGRRQVLQHTGRLLQLRHKYGPSPCPTGERGERGEC